MPACESDDPNARGQTGTERIEATMSLDADSIVDRRRMRRKLTFWRALAVLIAIGAVIAISTALRVPGTGVLTGEPGGAIARISINGLLRVDQERVEALDRLADSRAPAVIVRVN